MVEDLSATQPRVLKEKGVDCCLSLFCHLLIAPPNGHQRPELKPLLASFPQPLQCPLCTEAKNPMTSPSPLDYHRLTEVGKSLTFADRDPWS